MSNIRCLDHQNINDFKIEDDKLKIISQLDNVYNLINEHSQHTFAVTAPYGGGKTFFAKCLETSIKKHNEDTTVIYINLWENDYKDPFITLIAELLDKMKGKDNEIDSLLGKAKKVIGALVMNFSKAFSRNIIDEKVRDAMFEKKEQEDIKALKDQLTKIATKTKIVYLIDEIDRCRPDFAVEFLERMKHFFDIKNIVFVLFVNGEYINKLKENFVSISDHTHGTCSNYINKFIDYSIPLDVHKNLCYLYEALILKEYNNFKNKDQEFANYFTKTVLWWLGREAPKTIPLISRILNITARDIVQIVPFIINFYKDNQNRLTILYNLYKDIFKSELFNRDFIFLIAALRVKKETNILKNMLENFDVSYIDGLINQLVDVKHYLKDSKDMLNLIHDIPNKYNANNYNHLNLEARNAHLRILHYLLYN